MKIRAIAIGLSFLMISGIIFHWQKEDEGVFFGDPEVERRTQKFSRTMDQAEQLLIAHLENNNLMGEYVFFPYRIVYAHDGGYLFITGEFKINIRMKGFYVSPGGDVSFVDLERTIDERNYRGARDLNSSRIPGVDK